MAEQPIETTPVAPQDESSKAKEFVQLWVAESYTLNSNDLTTFTLESIIKFLHNGSRSYLQKVPDLEKSLKENARMKGELKRKQDSLHDKLNRIAKEVALIEEDANSCQSQAISKCNEIDRKIQEQKNEYEEKLRKEKTKQLEEVKRQTEHLYRAMKCEQMKMLDQYQEQIVQEEKEWQNLVKLSESKKKWRSMAEFNIPERERADQINMERNNVEFKLIVTESEEILDEIKMPELTVKAEEPVIAPVKYISVKTKSDGQLVATVAVNQSELSSLKLAGFRALANELPTDFTFLFKGAPIRLGQESKFALKQVLDGDNVWIKN